MKNSAHFLVGLKRETVAETNWF